eukprot:791920-Prorocentrum_minimum.AAC.2
MASCPGRALDTDAALPLADAPPGGLDRANDRWTCGVGANHRWTCGAGPRGQTSTTCSTAGCGGTERTSWRMSWRGGR